MNNETYNKYAHVLVEIGVNMQKNEIVIIKASPKNYILVREIAIVCYKLGAKFVKVDYEDNCLNKIRAKYSNESYLYYFPKWFSKYMKEYAEDNVCIIELFSPSFNEEYNIDINRLNKVQNSIIDCKVEYSESISSGRVSMVKACVPSIEWAKKAFPNLKEEKALLKLWDNIIKICRLDEDDPVKAWKEHKFEMKNKKEVLNKLNIKKLMFKSSGTDLELELVENGQWLGGYAVNEKDKTEYVPNIPTEEIFYVPHKYKVNGEVKSTIPLIYDGTVIEGIWLKVKDGRVVQSSAKTGYEMLKKILNTDEGSSYFGEVALVSIESPIYQTNTVFYNTLYDENAVCHIALGNATPSIIKNGYKLNKDELDLLGINHSKIHVDFMVGSGNLDVIAVTIDEKYINIMKDGDWVI